MSTILTAPGNGIRTPGPLHYSNFLRRVWNPGLRAMNEYGPGFQHRTTHDLRHTFASFLIQGGEHPKVISTLLGHSSIKITMDLYGHLMDGFGASAASTIDKLAGGLLSPDPDVNASLGVFQASFTNGKLTHQGLDPEWTPDSLELTSR